MSRKHFKALAAIVVRMHDDGLLSINVHKRLVQELGDVCYDDNNRFDLFQFNRACGLEINGKRGMWQPVENI